MNSYFSTFSTGFSDVIRQFLKDQISDVKIVLLLDGLVAYRTDSRVEDIKNLQFFNNSYSLVHYLKNTTTRPFSEIKEWMTESPDFNNNLKKGLDKNTESLKLVFVEANQYTHLDAHFVESIVELVRRRARIDSSISQGDQELWFLARNEGYSVLGLRIDNRPPEPIILQKGELRPELVHILNLLSEPKEDDVFLDPFAGSGAIPLERAAGFPFKHIIASDNDHAKLKSLREKVTDSRIDVYEIDALALSSKIDKLSIDTIVTDPPWGIYGEKINIGSFYPKMLDEMYKVLKPQGVMVLLVSRLIDMDKLLIPFELKFKVLKRINTLVNGQKATVYQIKKIS